MFTKVREGSRYGACSVLGELVEETETPLLLPPTLRQRIGIVYRETIAIDSHRAVQGVRGLLRAQRAALDATSFAGEQESQARKLSRKRSLSAASG